MIPIIARIFHKNVGIVVLSLMVGLMNVQCASQMAAKPMAPSWVALKGRGVPEPYVMKPIISNAQRLQLSFKFEGFSQVQKQENTVQYQLLRIPKAGYTTEIGKPDLPVIRELVAVPEGKAVRASFAGKTHFVRSGYTIYPVQEPVVEQGPYRTKFTIDKRIYALDQYYPAKTLKVSPTMIMAGQNVVQIEVFPIQYNPAKKTLKIVTDIEIKIDFVDIEGKAKTSRTKKALSLTPAYWKQFKSFVNIDWLKDFVVLNTRANYLIISADEFVEEIAPLAQWKKMKGLSTKIVKLSTIGSSDTQIRNYISNAYHNWSVPPSYVLLVGDVELVPTHIYTSGTTSCATDLFYATVDGTDFLPDLAVGRFSAKTEAEVEGMVAKSIAYEKTPNTSDSQWFSRVSLVSDDGYFQDTSNWIYDYLFERGYEVDRFYHSTGTATTTNVANAANQGRIILNYRGHGGVTGWGTSNFRNADVLALNNDSRLPVIISPTCQTGWYDHATLDSYGETWLKAGGQAGESGGVAFWGSSRNSYGGYNDELAKGVYKAEFEDGLSAFGDITNKAKLYMFAVYGASSIAQLEFNLFNVMGDPELNVWFQVPFALPPDWKAIDLDILGSNRTGGVNKAIMQDVGGQNAFPVLVYPYGTSAASFMTFSVPADWDGTSDFLVDLVWYSPTQDGNLKWSIVYDRKDSSTTPFKGFNRHVKYFWGIRKERVSHSAIEVWSLTNHGPLNPGDVITLGLERFRFNSGETGGENAITTDVNLMAARVLYRAESP